MEKDNNIYLKNIIDKVNEAMEYCSGFSGNNFIEDKKTQSAVMLKLIIIGE